MTVFPYSGRVKSPELPSTPNLVRRRGSRIYPMQARLYGREVTFSVMYPSGFKVPCTKAEKCGVDSPLDKA